MLEDRKLRYKEFCERNLIEGKYNPELAVDTLLSCLTPDTKPIVLAGMEPGEVYRSHYKIYKQVSDYLKNLGVGISFPATSRTAWDYFELKDKKGNVREGSLVRAGAVRRVFDIATGLGYQVTPAGSELVTSLIPSMAEFIENTEGKVKFNSMWRIFGHLASRTGRRRAELVKDLVKFLYENDDWYSCTEIQEKFKGKWDEIAISSTLNDLGDYKIIDYESPYREIDGKRARGWATYSVDDLDLFKDREEEIGRDLERKGVRKSYLSRVIEYIQTHPDETYERNKLGDRLKISVSRVSVTLSSLSKFGVLKPESGFTAYLKSRARANDVTRELYETIIKPAEDIALNLAPLEEEITPHHVLTILENYEEERTKMGVRGGKRVKNIVLKVLKEGDGELKLSSIQGRANKILRKLDGRELKSFKGCLSGLMNSGKVKRTKKGFYRLAQ